MPAETHAWLRGSPCPRHAITLRRVRAVSLVGRPRRRLLMLPIAGGKLRIPRRTAANCSRGDFKDCDSLMAARTFLPRFVAGFLPAMMSRPRFVAALASSAKSAADASGFRRVFAASSGCRSSGRAPRTWRAGSDREFAGESFSVCSYRSVLVVSVAVTPPRARSTKRCSPASVLSSARRMFSDSSVPSTRSNWPSVPVKAASPTAGHHRAPRSRSGSRNTAEQVSGLLNASVEHRQQH